MSDTYLSYDTIASWPLTSDNALQWKQRIDQVDPIINSDNRFSMEQLWRMIVVATELETSTPVQSDFSLDINALQCLVLPETLPESKGTNSKRRAVLVDPSHLLDFLIQFKNIKRLKLLADQYHCEKMNLVFFVLKAMPKLKSVLLDGPKLVNWMVDQLFESRRLSIATVLFDYDVDSAISVYETMPWKHWKDSSSWHNRQMRLSAFALEDYYLDRLVAFDIQKMLAPTLLVSDEDRQNHLLKLVSHCDQFHTLSQETWIRLVTVPQYRVVFDAIMDKIQQGKTLHNIVTHQGLKLFRQQELFELLESETASAFIIELGRAGYNFTNQPVPSSISPVLYHRYLQNSIHFHYSFSPLFLSLLKSWQCLKTDRNPLYAAIVDQVDRYTKEHMDSKSFADTLASLIDGYTKAMIEFLLALDDTIYPKLVESIQNFDAPWAAIVDALLVEREAKLLDWLLETEPTIIRRHMNEALCGFDWSRSASFLFTHWLKTHGFSPQQQHEPLTRQQPKKRGREAGDQHELPANKHAKSVPDKEEENQPIAL